MRTTLTRHLMRNSLPWPVVALLLLITVLMILSSVGFGYAQPDGRLTIAAGSTIWTREQTSARSLLLLDTPDMSRAWFRDIRGFYAFECTADTCHVYGEGWTAHPVRLSDQ